MQANITEQLTKILQKDLVDLETLKSKLEQEKEALKTREHGLISKLASDKSALVQMIETRAKAKYKLLSSAGINPSKERVSAKLAKLGDKKLGILWTAVKKLTQDCKDANQVNGQVIQRSLQRTNHIMNILRGQQGQKGLYGQQGREKAMGGSQRIAKA